MSPKVLLAALLLAVSVTSQETLEDRIQTVFGAAPNNTAEPGLATSTANPRAGFDVVVQPDPIVEVSALLNTTSNFRKVIFEWHN